MRSTPGCAPILALALAWLLAGPSCSRTGSGPGTGSLTDGDTSGPAADRRVTFGSGRTLYARLGGVDGIRVVVDELVGRMAADQRIQQFFVATDFRRFKGMLVVHICELSGGPCRYRGRPLRQVHRGRRIRPAHFEAMVEDVREALRAAQVGEREQTELLAILRTLEPEIIEP
jgi:hemoglobin